MWPYWQLLRPANVVTAAADILAGAAATSPANFNRLPWLVVAGMSLYGGGVVLNDVFDARLDTQERPERPIPSGRANVRGAGWLGAVLLALGVAAATMVSLTSGALALLIAAGVILYDARAKHLRLLGPLAMGSCRGLNLLLGVSLVPAILHTHWFLGLFPLAYIVAVTVVSAGEVQGGQRSAGLLSLALLGAVLLGLLALTVRPGFNLLPLLPFLALLAYRVIPPFWRAAVTPQPGLIRSAVKAGVLSLIVLDSAIAAGYGGLLYGSAVLALLFLASGLARTFAVT